MEILNKNFVLRRFNRWLVRRNKFFERSNDRDKLRDKLNIDSFRNDTWFIVVPFDDTWFIDVSFYEVGWVDIRFDDVEWADHVFFGDMVFTFGRDEITVMVLFFGFDFSGFVWLFDDRKIFFGFVDRNIFSVFCDNVTFQHRFECRFVIATSTFETFQINRHITTKGHMNIVVGRSWIRWKTISAESFGCSARGIRGFRVSRIQSFSEFYRFGILRLSTCFEFSLNDVDLEVFYIFFFGDSVKTSTMLSKTSVANTRTEKVELNVLKQEAITQIMIIQIQVIIFLFNLNTNFFFKFNIDIILNSNFLGYSIKTLIYHFTQKHQLLNL